MAIVEAVQEMVGAELARSEVPVPRRIQEIAAVLRAELPARFPGQPLEIRLEREYFPLRVYGIRVFPRGVPGLKGGDRKRRGQKLVVPPLSLSLLPPGRVRRR